MILRVILRGKFGFNFLIGALFVFVSLSRGYVQSHWTLAVINFRLQRLEYYDSLAQKIGDEAFEVREAVGLLFGGNVGILLRVLHTSRCDFDCTYAQGMKEKLSHWVTNMRRQKGL